MKRFPLLRDPLFSWYAFFWFVYFVVFWSRIFTYDSHYNLQAHHINVWGDWAIHFTMGSSMAYRSLFLNESPLLFGVPFRYPFFVNLISAFLIRAGVPFLKAFSLPSFIYCFIFVCILFWFYFVIFKNSRIAFFSSLIFLFNGGAGVLLFISDIVRSTNPFKTLFFPPETYTNYETHFIKWSSVITTMLIPQRSFQLGFPLALVFMILLIRQLEAADQTYEGTFFLSWRAPVFGGLIWGLMPLIHMHAFVFLSSLVPFWFLGDLLQQKTPFSRIRFRFWWIMTGVAILLAVPICLYYDLVGGGNVSGIHWYPGWYARKWEMNWILFWLRNWGLAPFCGLVGSIIWIKSGLSNRTRLISSLMLMPFLLFFVLPNLLQFHPWIWDNTKFLIWSSLAISGFSGYLIHQIAGSKPKKPDSPLDHLPYDAGR